MDLTRPCRYKEKKRSVREKKRKARLLEEEVVWSYPCVVELGLNAGHLALLLVLSAEDVELRGV